MNKSFGSKMTQGHKIKGWFCWVRLLSRECRSWGFFPTCFNECSSPVGNCNLGQVSLISLFININQRKGIEWESRVDRRRQWHSTPVLSPGKSLGQRSLVDCSPWGREESDTTERLQFHFTFMHWRRKWQPTPVFLPGESQGQGSLVGCRLWGRTELDTTEAT